MGLRRTKRWLHRFAEWAVIGSLALLSLLVILQIGFRFILQAPLAWPEELSRLIFIYLVFIGGALASRNREHIRIDLVDGWIKSRTRLAMLSFARLLGTAAALIVVAVGCIQIIPRLADMRLAATGVSMMWMTVPVLVGSLLMAFWALAEAVEGFRKMGAGGKGRDSESPPSSPTD